MCINVLWKYDLWIQNRSYKRLTLKFCLIFMSVKTLVASLVLTHKFQFIFLSNNITLSYNSVFVTVSFEMSDNALFKLSPKRPFEMKHLLDLVDVGCPSDCPIDYFICCIFVADRLIWKAGTRLIWKVLA